MGPNGVEEEADQQRMAHGELTEGMIFVGLEVGGTNLKAGILNLMTGACSTVKVEPLSAESSAREPEV